MNLPDHNPSAARVLLAALPVMGFVPDLVHGVYYAVLISLCFGLSSLLLLFLTACVPSKLVRPGFYLWLAVLGQSIFSALNASPVWLLSIILLVPDEAYENDKRTVAVRKFFLRGIFFFVLLLYLAAFHHLLGDRLLVWSFRLPVGTLFLLAVAAILWQNQPGAVPAEEFRKETDS